MRARPERQFCCLHLNGALSSARKLQIKLLAKRDTNGRRSRLLGMLCRNFTVCSPTFVFSRQHPQIPPLKPFHHYPQGLGLDDLDLIAPLVEMPNHLNPT